MDNSSTPSTPPEEPNNPPEEPPFGPASRGLPERLGGAVPALIRTCVAFGLFKPEESDRGRLIIGNVEV